MDIINRYINSFNLTKKDIENILEYNKSYEKNKKYIINYMKNIKQLSNKEIDEINIMLSLIDEAITLKQMYDKIQNL